MQAAVKRRFGIVFADTIAVLIVLEQRITFITGIDDFLQVAVIVVIVIDVLVFTGHIALGVRRSAGLLVEPARGIVGIVEVMTAHILVIHQLAEMGMAVDQRIAIGIGHRGLGSAHRATTAQHSVTEVAEVPIVVLRHPPGRTDVFSNPAFGIIAIGFPIAMRIFMPETVTPCVVTESVDIGIKIGENRTPKIRNLPEGFKKNGIFFSVCFGPFF